MFSTAGMSGDERVLASAKEMFSKFMDGDRSAIHPNIRASVFSINLKYGGEKEVRQSIIMIKSNRAHHPVGQV